MWNDVLKLALTNGIFAALFVALLCYVLKDGASREKKYQKTIEKLSNHLDIVEDIKVEVEEVHTILETKSRRKKSSQEL